MANTIEQIGLREQSALNLKNTGRRFHEISARRFHGSWFNMGLSAFLTFGNLALLDAFQGETHRLQVMNAVVYSMPVEACALIGILFHQNKRYPDQVIPLSTHVLPKIGALSIRLGRRLMPKRLPEPTLW